MSARESSAFVRHLILVFGSQILVLVSGLIKALIIPLVLSVEDLGYWQIYVFYVAYVGVFSLGYNDGVYLKYGGYRLENLPLDRLRASNTIHLVLLVLATLMMLLLAMLGSSPHRYLVLVAVAANIVVLGVVSNISLSLQAVNQLKSYAFLSSADKVFFTVSLLALFAQELRVFWFLIVVDLTSKVLVMALLCIRYRQLYIGSFIPAVEAAKEFAGNVYSGIQLMLANLSGMLVLGTGRIIIEYFGTLRSYAFYAFAISLANVILMSVSAVSVVLYPSLKQQERTEYLIYFNKTNVGFSAFALLMLTGYFPAAAFVLLIATKYSPVIEFLNAVFIITVLQGKMQLVNNTFYSALRLEGPMLVANLSSMVIAIILSSIGYMFTHSVLAVVYATLLTMLIRVYASEYVLRRQMGGTFEWMALVEIAALAGFMVLTTFTAPIIGLTIWSLVLIVTALAHRRKLASGWRRFRGSFND